MRKAYQDSIYNIVDYLSTIGILLITTKLSIARLGIDGYGFYMFFSSLIGTFGLVDIGMGMVVSKYLSEYLHQNKVSESNQVITQALLFYIVVGSILAAAVNGNSDRLLSLFNLGPKFSQIGASVLLMTSIVFILNLFVSVGTNVLVALEKWKSISLLNISLKLLNAFILVAILMLNIGVELKLEYIFVSILTFAALRLLLYGGIAYYRYPNYRWQRPTPAIRINITEFLKWSSIQYGLSLMVGHVDKIVISRFFGLEVLGYYSFVVNAFVYLYGFLANGFKIFLPKLSIIHASGDTVRLRLLFRKLLLGSIVSSLIIGGISVAIWIPFIGLYIDSKFAYATFSYFLVFTCYLVVRSPEIIFSYFFNATANPRILVRNVVVGSTVTVISYFALVPVYGAYGLIGAQMAGSLAIYCYVYVAIRINGFGKFAKL